MTGNGGKSGITGKQDRLEAEVSEEYAKLGVRGCKTHFQELLESTRVIRSRFRRILGVVRLFR